MIEKKRAAIIAQTKRSIINGHSPINFSPMKSNTFSQTPKGENFKKFSSSKTNYNSSK
jgi:hypothetical protein